MKKLNHELTNGCGSVAGCGSETQPEESDSDDDKLQDLVGHDIENQGRLEMTRPILKIAGQTMCPLEVILKQYENKRLIVPNYQRLLRWTKEKRKAFIQSLIGYSQSRPIPVGITTYQIIDDPKDIWLLDGKQRLETIKGLKIEPTSYNTCESEIGEILERVNFPINHIHVKNHEEAFGLYQQINIGTPLNAKDYYLGVLTNSKEWGWCAKAIKNLQATYLRMLLNQGIENAQGRETGQQASYKRYALGFLFMRIDNNSRCHDGVINTVGGKTRSIEDKLVKCLGITTKEEVLAIIKKSEQMIVNEIVYIKELYEKERKEGWAEFLSPSVLRACLSWASFKKDMKISVSKFGEFLKDVFLLTKGHHMAYTSAGKEIHFRGQDLNVLCHELKSDFNSGTKRKKRQGLPGYDNHHYKESFSRAGEGPTKLTPSLVNRSIGNKGFLVKKENKERK